MKLATKKQMNDLDQWAIAGGIASIDLMETAARELYHYLSKRFDPVTRFHIVCGIGNNGGDGLALARLLSLNGYGVSVQIIGEFTAMSPDCKINFQRCLQHQISFREDIQNCDVIVDALFGTGLSHDIQEPFYSVIQQINQSNKTIIAIDIPSGIHADSGEKLKIAIQADLTLTIQNVKPGLLIYPGRDHAGQIQLVSLGLPESIVKQVPLNYQSIDMDLLSRTLPRRSVHSHKGSYGKVLCIGGNTHTAGAILLAAKSALRSGCGMLSVAIPQSLHEMFLRLLPEAMVLACQEYDHQIDDLLLIQNKLHQYDCCLIGCGLGRNKQHEKCIGMLLQTHLPLVIDADGLVALKPHLPVLKNRKQVILTPHLAEFASLMNTDIQDIMDHSYQYVQAFCATYPDVTLVLKSETTIIAQNKELVINTMGNSGLAVGGSGDVLAGIIVGMLAQTKDPMMASVLGVGIHAMCADRLKEVYTEYSMLPSDVIEEIPNTIKAILANRS